MQQSGKAANSGCSRQRRRLQSSERAKILGRRNSVMKTIASICSASHSNRAYFKACARAIVGARDFPDVGTKIFEVEFVRKTQKMPFRTRQPFTRGKFNNDVWHFLVRVPLQQIRCASCHRYKRETRNSNESVQTAFPIRRYHSWLCLVVTIIGLATRRNTKACVDSLVLSRTSPPHTTTGSNRPRGGSRRLRSAAGPSRR